ncbi:MAG: MGMT family protein [Firmicutes bacterium]|nr:MGMT family protein [Bacillota bacterium]
MGGVGVKKVFSSSFNTVKGKFTVLWSERGIYEIFFPGSGPAEEYPEKELPWSQLAADFDHYLAGGQVSWSDYPLDCCDYGTFSARLLKAVCLIPSGKVCTYRQMAEQAGSPLAWRAAGQALARNRHPIIVPCHRVVGSNGKAGGFSGPAGWKEMLLKLEGAN